MADENIRIHFVFDRDKFATVMQMLCQFAPNLDVLKAVKLLYFIDRKHLRAYGHPILGDFYVAMPLGPVPSQAYDELKRVQAGEAPELPFRSKDLGGKYTVFEATSEPDHSYLSELELASVREVIRELGRMSGPELSDIAHKHQTWMQSRPDDPCSAPPRIEYRKFFSEDLDECKSALEAMILEQEERDFARGL